MLRFRSSEPHAGHSTQPPSTDRAMTDPMVPDPTADTVPSGSANCSYRSPLGTLRITTLTLCIGWGDLMHKVQREKDRKDS